MTDVALRDCGRWLSGGTPSTENPSYWGGNIPWITSSSLKGRYLDRSQRQLTEEGVVAGSRLVEPGTLIFVVRGMSLKNEFRVGISTRPLAFGQDCKALVPAEGIDSKYLLFALEAAEDRVLRMVDEASHGTGRLQTSLLGALRVRMPPLEEQRRIAEILDTIDETIQATERVIDKLRSLRDGLSQSLFAADRDYPLRPLADFAVKIQDGTHFSPASESGPFRYVTSKNIRMGLVDLSTATWISESEHRNIYRRCDTRRGDVLLTKDGANTGNVAVNELDEEISLLSSVAMLRCDEKSSSGRYLYHYLASTDGQRQMAAAMAGNAITRLTLVKIRRLLIPAPPIHEQQQIVAALDSLDRRIWAARDECEKLRSARLGLASDLLSGRVRTVAA